MKKQNDEITIKGLIDIFLPKLWIIALFSLVVAMIFGGYSYFLKTETYTSKAEYMVVKIPSNANADKTGVNMQEVEAMQHMVANARQIIHTQDFCERVLKSMERDDLTPKQIMNMLTITLSGDNTTCYYLAVTSPDAKISLEVAKVAGEHLTEEFKDMGYAINIKQIETPKEAQAPNPKNTIRNTVIGFAAGFIVSLLVIFIIDKFDVVIRTREKIEDNFDLPILGVIPRLEPDE